jgi:hypothetical protein
VARSAEEVDEAIACNGELRAFLALFPFVCPLEFYNQLGRFLLLSNRLSFHRYVQEHFNPTHYRAQAGLPEDMPDEDLLKHYLDKGSRKGLSPTPSFDEAFYLAFYDDVREAVEGTHSRLTCGYEHYFLTGEREGRMPVHQLDRALEARFRGITEPAGLSRLRTLEDALASPAVSAADRGERVVHVIVPDLNPDIFFGGYQSLVQLMKHLLANGHRLSILKSGRDVDGLHYFLYHQSDPETRDLFAAVPATGRTSGIEVGPNDRFIAYSGWDALVAAHLLEHTNADRFAFLVQEYEPIFLDHNSHRFLLESAYTTPHFPIFNSAPLMEYFRANRIGVFRNGETNGGFAVFEHVLSGAPQPDRHDDAGEATAPRTFLVYARPEAHAGRNLFEVCILALRAALQRVRLQHDWDFVGVGALSDLADVDLGGHHRLRLRARMDREAYTRLLDSAYAGLSLMYAPHPSLVPFELAQSGALVVTNLYSNRGTAYFDDISPNIVPAELSLESVTEQVAAVLERADRLTAKPCPRFNNRWSRSWDEACRSITSRLAEEDLV